MRSLVVYDTRFGNTERLASMLAARLADHGPTRLATVAEPMPDLRDIDLLAVGGPTQMHAASPAMRDWLAGVPRGALAGVAALAFDTRLPKSRWLTGSAAGRIARRLRRADARLLAPPESFFVVGRDGPLAGGELERADAWLADALTRLPLEAPARARRHTGSMLRGALLEVY